MDDEKDNKPKGQENTTFTPEPPQDMNPSEPPAHEKKKKAKGATEPRKANGTKKAGKGKAKPLGKSAG
jgi:hypothetical protein